MDWSEFRQQVTLAFNEDELHTLCFDLHIDYESLSGNNKNVKVRELIALMRRQNRVPELVSVLNDARPHIAWGSVLETNASPAIGHENMPDVRLVAALALGLVVVAIIVFLFLQTQPTPETAVTELTSATEVPASEPVTAVSTAAPASTNTPLAVGATSPVIAPVEADEYMVLVAQLEPLTANERSVTRFIVDDLKQMLEVAIPFSNLRIREYPEIITTDGQARAVAEEYGAAVIVWGNYDDVVAEVEVQVGSLALFPEMLFDRALLEHTFNIRTQLRNPRQESLSPRLMGIIFVLELAANQSTVMGTAVQAETYAILNRTGKSPSSLIGDSVAVRNYQFADALFSGNLTEAIGHLDEALNLGGGNPILYFMRGGAHSQAADFKNATIDVQTAIRLGPEKWVNPHELLGFIALMQNDPQRALQYFENGVQWQPDQWRSFYNRALVNFLMGNYEQARADMDQAIALNPEVNWPYVFAIQTALRQGRLLEAITLGNVVLEKFPDPVLGNRILKASTNNAFVIGPIISGVTNGLLQQWQQVLRDVESVTAVNDEIPDVYWMQGFAHCNLQDYEAAEASYTRAIELDAGFILPYLGRAAVRLQQGNVEGAEADFQTIENSELRDAFAPFIPLMRARQLTCRNFLTFSQNQ